MPLRPFGLPTFSVQSRFLVEMMIMEAAKIASGADPTVLERVRDVFTTRLYGPGTAEGRPRPLIRLSIVEIETLQTIGPIRDPWGHRPRWTSALITPMTPTRPRRMSPRSLVRKDGTPRSPQPRGIRPDHLRARNRRPAVPLYCRWPTCSPS